MELKIKNLLSIGNILTVVTLILTIISVAMYGASVSMPGYFIGTGDSLVFLLSVLVIVFLALIICMNFIKFKGVLGNVESIVKDVLIVVSSLFLMIVLMNFIGSRIEGFSYIFFANDAGKEEIQTAENMASAQAAINAIIVYAVTWLVSIVSSFFSMEKKAVKEENVVKQN